MNYHCHLSTPLGDFTAASDESALTSLFFGKVTPPDSIYDEMHPIFCESRCWLEGYFAGTATDPPDFPMKAHGTIFQTLVWEEIRKIPYGKSLTYGAVAAAVAGKLGKPRISAQAVGQAVGANPLPIAVPCHRVLGANGNLTGYAGGLEMKIALLCLEKIPFKM